MWRCWWFTVLRDDDGGGGWRNGVEEKTAESWRVRVRVRVRRHRLLAIVLPLTTAREVSSALGFSDTVVSALGFYVSPFFFSHFFFLSHSQNLKGIYFFSIINSENFQFQENKNIHYIHFLRQNGEYQTVLFAKQRKRKRRKLHDVVRRVSSLLILFFPRFDSEFPFIFFSYIFSATKWNLYGCIFSIHSH